MSQTLFDILSFDERVIVLSDVGECLIYTWNQSLTLQCWALRGSSQDWEEVNVRTLSDKPEDFKAARVAAMRWATDSQEEVQS